MNDLILLWGTGGFGAVIGWYVYYVNRYRKADVQLGDITTVVATLGGAAVTRLFATGTPLFGAYGIGLFVGFFAYFLSLIILVSISKNFMSDWFLDGRRKILGTDEIIPDYVRQPGAALNVERNR